MVASLSFCVSIGFVYSRRRKTNSSALMGFFGSRKRLQQSCFVGACLFLHVSRFMSPYSRFFLFLEAALLLHSSSSGWRCAHGAAGDFDNTISKGSMFVTLRVRVLYAYLTRLRRVPSLGGDPRGSNVPTKINYFTYY